MNIAPVSRALLLTTTLSAAMGLPAFADDLTIGVRAGPLSIDPDFTAAGSHAEAMKHIFDTLIRSGNELQLKPGLAENWSAIDDVTWEFKLRKNVKFHDGSDFTVEDVKFSIERIPLVAGPNPTTIYVRRVASTEVVDSHTIRVKTNGPAPTLPNDFVRLFIVSHVAAKGLNSAEEASAAFNSGKAAIGTGPLEDELLLRRPGHELIGHTQQVLLGYEHSPLSFD